MDIYQLFYFSSRSSPVKPLSPQHRERQSNMSVILMCYRASQVANLSCTTITLHNQSCIRQHYHYFWVVIIALWWFLELNDGRVSTSQTTRKHFSSIMMLHQSSHIGLMKPRMVCVCVCVEREPAVEWCQCWLTNLWHKHSGVCRELVNSWRRAQVRKRERGVGWEKGRRVMRMIYS